jgi:hypothetical protein
MSNAPASRPGPVPLSAPLSGSPQRYSASYSRYLQLGGQLRPEELVPGFTAGGENQGDTARFFFFCLVFDQLAKEGLPGDLAELGVYKGNTATLLAAMARKLGRTAYLLDTFEGFDAADLKGVDDGIDPRAFGDTSLEAVRALVGEDNARYIKGYFPQTATQLPEDGRYCLVHIDCDLYAPIRSALEYFYPRVVPGGFLIIHDYSSLCWDGADKAVDEFFADKIESPAPLPDSAGSVVVRKAKSGGPGDNWLMAKRAALLCGDWVSAGNGALRELLGEGWSGPEEWGVWGVGAAHELRLALAQPIPSAFELEFDVHAVLAGKRTAQHVEVSANGRKLAVWEFTQEANHGVRRLRMRIERPPAPVEGYVPLVLLFRPVATETPRQLAAELHDDRPLGMAMTRIRYQAIE